MKSRSGTCGWRFPTSRTLVFGALVCGALASVPGPSAAGDVSTGPAPSVPFNWSGFYAGVNAGYASGSQSGNQGLSFPPSNAGDCGGGCRGASNGFSSGGAVGGFQAGYNHQFGNTVLGVEGDIGMPMGSSGAPPTGRRTPY